MAQRAAPRPGCAVGQRPFQRRMTNLLKGTAVRALPVALAVSGLLGCSHEAPALSTARSVPSSSLHVAVEGFCSKLALARLANRTIIVHGRAGDQPGEVSESFTEIVGTTLHRPVDLLSGLPVDPRGYVPEDLALFGWWPNATLLRRTRLERLPIGGPIDIEEVKSLRRWNGKWIDERHHSSAVRAAQLNQRTFASWSGPITSPRRATEAWCGRSRGSARTRAALHARARSCGWDGAAHPPTGCSCRR